MVREAAGSAESHHRTRVEAQALGLRPVFEHPPAVSASPPTSRPLAVGPRALTGAATLFGVSVQEVSLRRGRTMRIILIALVAVAAAVHTGCYGRANVQCELDSHCDLFGGGVCTMAGTG